MFLFLESFSIETILELGTTTNCWILGSDQIRSLSPTKYGSVHRYRYYYDYIGGLEVVPYRTVIRNFESGSGRPIEKLFPDFFFDLSIKIRIRIWIRNRFRNGVPVPYTARYSRKFGFMVLLLS